MIAFKEETYTGRPRVIFSLPPGAPRLQSHVSTQSIANLFIALLQPFLPVCHFSNCANAISGSRDPAPLSQPASKARWSNLRLRLRCQYLLPFPRLMPDVLRKPRSGQHSRNLSHLDELTLSELLMAKGWVVVVVVVSKIQRTEVVARAIQKSALGAITKRANSGKAAPFSTNNFFHSRTHGSFA